MCQFTSFSFQLLILYFLVIFPSAFIFTFNLSSLKLMTHYLGTQFLFLSCFVCLFILLKWPTPLTPFKGDLEGLCLLLFCDCRSLFSKNTYFYPLTRDIFSALLFAGWAGSRRSSLYQTATCWARFTKRIASSTFKMWCYRRRLCLKTTSCPLCPASSISTKSKSSPSFR